MLRTLVDKHVALPSKETRNYPNATHSRYLIYKYIAAKPRSSFIQALTSIGEMSNFHAYLPTTRFKIVIHQPWIAYMGGAMVFSNAKYPNYGLSVY